MLDSPSQVKVGLEGSNDEGCVAAAANTAETAIVGEVGGRSAESPRSGFAKAS